MSSLRCSSAIAASAPYGGGPAAQHRPAAVQHGGPRVVQGAGLLAQAAPATVQLLERVLDHVFGGSQVADHE